MYVCLSIGRSHRFLVSPQSHLQEIHPLQAQLTSEGVLLLPYTEIGVASLVDRLRTVRVLSPAWRRSHRLILVGMICR